VKKDAQAQRELIRRYGHKIARGGFTQMSKDLGVNRGLLWRVYHGHMTSNKVRFALGLKCKMIKVRVCEKCGKVHLAKNCTMKKRSRFPKFLKAIQEVVVPFLMETESAFEKR